MVRLILFATLAMTCTVVGCSDQRDGKAPGGSANLLLINARVYTLDWDDAAPDGTLMPGAPHDDNGWHPDAEALVISDKTIAFVGSNEEAMNYRNDQSRIVDLAGATVIPGLIDSHTHVFELGERIDRVNLVDAKTEEDAVALIVERAKEVPEGDWIIGLGWDEGAWADNYPDKLLISEAVPNHPVFMRGLHGFADWCNQLALDNGGITAATPVPVGGEMRLGADGQPNGLFINNAVTVLRDTMPEP